MLILIVIIDEDFRMLLLLIWCNGDFDCEENHDDDSDGVDGDDDVDGNDDGDLHLWQPVHFQATHSWTHHPIAAPDDGGFPTPGNIGDEYWHRDIFQWVLDTQNF